MQLKFLPLVLILVACPFSLSKPYPKEEAAKVSESPGETTPAPWLKYLKSKKTTTVAPTISPPSLEIAGGKRVKGGVSASIRAASTPDGQGTGQANGMDELAQWLGISVQPSGDALALDRQQNPDSLYDLMYLDWAKRDLGATAVESDNSDGSAGPMPTPQPQVAGYPYPPAYAYPYVNPLYSLASFKMQQKAMDAAMMAAWNITTTPKPLKLKLKIQVPGNLDMTQLGQITAGLANSLPQGSTYELA